MVDTNIVGAATERRPIKDFDPELSALFNQDFPDQDELEDILYHRAEKGLSKPKE